MFFWPLPYLRLLVLLSAWTGPLLLLAQTPPSAADSLYQLGKGQYYDGEYRLAETNLLASLAGYQAQRPPDRARLFKCQYRLGKVYGKQRQFAVAVTYFRRAEALARAKFGENSGELADVLVELATVFSKNMQLDSAQVYNETALGLYRRRFGAQSDAVASQYMHMAINDYKEGNYHRAERHYTKAFRIFRKTSAPEDQNFNRIYSNMGMLYRKTGDLQKSLDYARQALRIKRLHYPADHPSVAKYHSNLGRVLLRMGRSEEAIAAFKAGMAISTRGLDADHPELGGAYCDLADSYAEIGDLDRSTEWYKKGTAILRQRLDDDHPYVLAGDFNIARNEVAQGRYRAAIKRLEPALERLRQRGDFMNLQVARGMGQLAEARAGLAEWDRALEVLQAALGKLDPQLDPRDLTQQPRIQKIGDQLVLLQLLYDKAQLLVQRHAEQNDAPLTDLETALATVATSKTIILRLRRGYVSPRSQRFLNEMASPIFQLGVRIAYELYERTGKRRYQNTAFQYSELDRASLLWRTIQEQQAQLWAALPLPNRQQLRELREAIGRAEEARDWPLVLEQRERYAQVVGTLEESYPRYAQLKFSPPAATLSDLIERLPHPSAALVTYYYEDNRLYHFLVSKQGIISQRSELAGGLVDSIQQLRTYDIENLIQHQLLSPHSRNRTVDFLYRNLWAPIEPWLRQQSIERITIVPYAALHYLSFDLLHPPPSTENGPVNYLVQAYALSYAYSANLWQNPRATTPDFRHDFLGFAPQYTPPAIARPAGPGYVYREGLNPLPFAQREIQGAQHYFEGPSFLREAATEDRFKSEATDARIVHLAMHARVNDRAPLQSALYFQSPDSTSTEDGVLTLGEIYQLALPAELAVVSACNTGYGQLATGEGVQSLANAFQHAGCRSLLTHLWPANDQSAAQLIDHFYQGLARGLSKDVALQLAKQQYLKEADPLAAQPFFWAGLVLIGDQSPLTRTSWRSSAGRYGWALLLCLLMLALAFGGRRLIRP
ncbi:MAG: CHAT domain-containing tetratricopeptide repeat protein [Bacteroidota bacterium]